MRSCREEAAQALTRLGSRAEKIVGAFALLHIGQSLKWPEWLVDGSSLKAGEPFPSMMRLADKLVLVANFFDLVSPFDFAVRVMRLPLTGLSPLAALGFHVAPTLGDALELRARFRSLGAPHLQIDYCRGAEFGEVTVRSDVLDPQLLGGYGVASLALFYTLAESMVPAAATTARLEFTLEGSHQQLLADEVRCPVMFGAAVDRLSIPQHLLDEPNRDYDRGLWELVQRSGPDVPGPLGQALSDVLMAKVRLHLDQRRVPRLKQVAAELHMSERTIVRMLHAEGTSFRLLVDDERRARAVALLADHTVELLQAAHVLGFADGPSFWRTFRRWFGVTPAQYRRD